MEAIPASQPCQICLRQPMLLLSFVQQKDSLARGAVSQLLYYLLTSTGKTPAERTEPGLRRGESRYKTQYEDQMWGLRNPG